ncbi:MAG: MarP family serine protease [Actinomycetota bacterium]|nr:MarP family serine protease [Actinomycetota bacterium]
MNVVDYIIIGAVALAAVRGWRRGFVGQVFEFGGGLVGLLFGLWLGPELASLVTDEPGLEGVVISLVTVFVALSIGQTIGFTIGYRFFMAARRARLGPPDSLLGAGTAVVVTTVVLWLVGSFLVAGPSRPIAKAVNRSLVLDRLNGALPQPPNVFAYIRQYLDTSGFPQVFAGFPRPIGPPVKLPSSATAQQAIRAADQSTVRIVAPACGGTQLGSGWVAADSTVVTNAHVVAGGDSVSVEDSNGSHVGTVVVFDPETDVAVLRVSGLAGRPLPLVTAPQERGTPGATLGFPGDTGGVMRVHPAAVNQSFSASGRDIYGRSLVTRDVYELRSPVRQGDSGGPFVLPSGGVAGVVFAAATTDADTGYALTGREVSDEVARGARSSRPVDTGPCTR